MLADLDELAVRVLNLESRRNVEDAIRVLRAGSPRAAILLTWLAVVYDVLGKLRELEEGGDLPAKALREEYDAIRTSEDVRKSQDFEGRIPVIASNLELISNLEKRDLERLKSERHRCAHPSQTDESTPYLPSDELARYHIRVAVESLLQFPPTQGKAALARIQADIDSPYFPIEDAAAHERMRRHIGRARQSLIRNLAITLMKAILGDPPTELSVRRRSALIALWKIHPAELDGLARHKLSSLAAQTSDDQLRQLLFLVRPLEQLFAVLDRTLKDRLRLYIESPPTAEDIFATASALAMNEYRSAGLVRLSRYSTADYYAAVTMAGKNIPPDLVRVLVSELFKNSHQPLGDELIRRFTAVAPLMTPPEIGAFFELLVKDGKPQVTHAADVEPVVSRFDKSIAEREFRASSAAALYPWEDMRLPF